MILQLHKAYGADKFYTSVKKKFFKNSELVSWFFEPSQPQMITSGLRTKFSLSPSYSLNKL